jgi:nucleotide-binding universal stress UspA family protein
MFKTIVVGVDGRDGGWDALALAGRLALLGGGELVAVRALSLDYYARSGAPELTAIAKRDAEAQLHQRLTETGLDAEVQVIHGGSPARALHRVAETSSADLIVVGSTRHGALGRVFIGDRAAATLHGSPCPVAVAPRGLAGQEWRRHVERIGVGFDGRPDATRALAFAARLARGCGARLAVRFVVASPISAVDFSAYDIDWLERSRAHAAEEMARVLDAVDVAVSSDIAVGSPVDELVDLSTSADLVVLGSRGSGPFRRTMAGSTAVGVMRRAHAPVLVVPRATATGSSRSRTLKEKQPWPAI